MALWPRRCTKYDLPSRHACGDDEDVGDDDDDDDDDDDEDGNGKMTSARESVIVIMTW